MSEEKQQETYFCEVKCKNCDYGYPYDGGFAVPKGMNFKQFSKRTECPRCGCKGTICFLKTSRR